MILDVGIVQGGATNHNLDMDKSAVWAGSGCIAVSPISGLRLVAPLCTSHEGRIGLVPSHLALPLLDKPHA